MFVCIGNTRRPHRWKDHPAKCLDPQYCGGLAGCCIEEGSNAEHQQCEREQTVRAKPPDKPVSQEEYGQLRERGDHQCQSHGRLTCAELCHVGEEIRRGREGANPTQDCEEQKSNPAAAGQKEAHATRLHRRFLLRAVHEFPANEEIDQHEGRERPKANPQTVLLHEHPGNRGEQSPSNRAAQPDTTVHGALIAQHGHGTAIGEGGHWRYECIEQHDHEKDSRKACE
jgi:hypothetical protein